MELAKYKACICEGSAEEAIIDMLVHNDLLIFKREEMLEERVIRCRSAIMTNQKYKNFTLREFDTAAEKFDDDDPSVYNLCRKDYPDLLEELLKEPCQDVLDCGYKIKYAAFRKADMHIWFGDKGTYDRSFRKISEKQIPAGVCYQMKVVKNCGHGGLFSEPKRMLKAITAAGNHEKGM